MAITFLLDIACLAAPMSWADRLWRWSRCAEGFTLMVLIVWAVQLTVEAVNR
ncbi:hypothetical protein [Nocardia sp. NPDC127526]|uniref:hypothetical protein n=1 Tax=Nocardia sp. NPDC127526 TaxID=3345393 RepID=UPI00362E9BC4